MVDWLQISQVTGSSGIYTVTVTASSTSELTARTTSLTVTAHAPATRPFWTDKQEYVVTNQAGTGTLVVIPSGLQNRIQFNSSGGTATIDITTYMGNWVLTNNSDWLTFSQTTGGTGHTIVYVTANTSSQVTIRNTTINITDGDTTRQTYVRQWGIFSVVPNSFTFPASGGVESFTVTSSRDWSITNVPAWITMSQVSGYNGTYTVTMTADTNTGAVRTGSFTVSDGYSTVNCSISQNDGNYSSEYLTFNVISGGTLTWLKTSHFIHPDYQTGKIIDYRINGGAWNTITANTSDSPTTISLNDGDKIEFRGENNAYARHNTHYDDLTVYASVFRGDVVFNVEGNIMSLIYGDNFVGQKMLTTGYTFAQLFSGCNIVDASGLVLPATGLTEFCYLDMFSDCNSMTAPPSLPATTLASYCYCRMFVNCDGLTDNTLPELPATTLASHCYDKMFNACNSIYDLSNYELPALTMAEACYAGMFEGSSLAIVPELPATTLAKLCYSGMYHDCYSLTSVPSDYLPVTSLAESCYNNMFAGCENLAAAPALPATALTRGCYANMFVGCDSFTIAPELPATTLAPYCYSQMFQGCIGLTRAPLLPATTLAEGCYDTMFFSCTSLTSMPPVLPAQTVPENAYNHMFWDCTAMTGVTEIRATSVGDSACTGMFSGCISITESPVLSATTLGDSSYRAMFWGCTSLRRIVCNALDISAPNCTTIWVVNVGQNGVFVKNPSMTSWTTGDDGIPDGWTVQNI